MTQKEKDIIKRLKKSFSQYPEKITLYGDGIRDVMKLIWLVESQETQINLLQLLNKINKEKIEDKNTIINDYRKERERLVKEMVNNNG